MIRSRNGGSIACEASVLDYIDHLDFSWQGRDLLCHVPLALAWHGRRPG